MISESEQENLSTQWNLFAVMIYWTACGVGLSVLAFLEFYGGRPWSGLASVCFASVPFFMASLKKLQLKHKRDQLIKLRVLSSSRGDFQTSIGEA